MATPKQEKPKPTPKERRILDRFRDFYPIEGGDPYYRNIETPLEFALLLMRDERKSLGVRWEAAQAAMPFLTSRPAPRPHVPTEQERIDAKEAKQVTVRLIRFRECDLPAAE